MHFGIKIATTDKKISPRWKWNIKKLDNTIMVTTTDRYLSQFEKIENEAINLNLPNEYEYIESSRIICLLEIELKINYK